MPDQLSFATLGERGGERKVYTVSGLLAGLKQSIDRDFFDVWIEGEISNFHQAASRHCYFTLKDAQGQIKAALFAGQARYLRFKLRDGLQVLVRGRISVYESRGELQCYVEHVEPLGRGGLQLAFEQLKEKLAAEGLFDPARKRPLPMLPRRIGLITSSRGAAIADMIGILRRRYPNVQILLYPVQVQGTGAAVEIAQAIGFFSALETSDPRQVEVLIVGRGGGSLEDLWPFNEEVVARALAGCPVPVISAVGHETDFTIADFVADLRAPTPSAAAELVIRPKSEFDRQWQATGRHLRQAIRFALLRHHRRLEVMARHRAFAALRHRMAQRSQALDELQYRAHGAMRARLAEFRHRLAMDATRVRHHDGHAVLRAGQVRAAIAARAVLVAWRTAAAARHHRLQAAEALLLERNPLHLLARGYALVYDGEGRLVNEPGAVAAGEALRIRFASGWLEATAGGRRPLG